MPKHTIYYVHVFMFVSGILDPCGGCGQRGDPASRVLPPEEVRHSPQIFFFIPLPCCSLPVFLYFILNAPLPTFVSFFGVSKPSLTAGKLMLRHSSLKCEDKYVISYYWHTFFEGGVQHCKCFLLLFFFALLADIED